MAPFIYPAGDNQETVNIGLATFGMDEVLAENMILIDAAFGSVSGSIKINGSVVNNPNFVNSATATLSVVGNNVSITAGSTFPTSPISFIPDAIQSVVSVGDEITIAGGKSTWDFEDTSVVTSGNSNGFTISRTINPPSSSSAAYQGIIVSLTMSASNAQTFSGGMKAGNFFATSQGSVTFNNGGLDGSTGNVAIAGFLVVCEPFNTAGSIIGQAGFVSKTFQGGNALISNNHGLISGSGIDQGTGGITNDYTIRVLAPRKSSSSSMTNHYGVFVQGGQTGGTGNANGWAIFVQGASDISQLGPLVLNGAAPTVAAGQIGLGNTVATTVGAAGGATAPPATPVGYLTINVSGTAYKVPYYNS
jgi:hypothetical protein